MQLNFRFSIDVCIFCTCSRMGMAVYCIYIISLIFMDIIGGDERERGEGFIRNSMTYFLIISENITKRQKFFF